MRLVSLERFGQWIRWLDAALDLAWLEASPGSKKMKGEMKLLLALVIFDGYLLFPSQAERDQR